MAFVKATKHQAKLRMALIGPSGSGKTYTALKIATGLGKRVALIDTERGSACHYASIFNFDTCELDSFHPDKYVQAIHDAEAAGYDVLIIDSLSHAWMGKDGALELVDAVTMRTQSKNSFGAWREVTPKHNDLVDAMVSCKCHIIVTMRAKMSYEVEQDEKTRKTSVRKIGLAPIQRDGLEYEFDVVADMTIENTIIVSKTRYAALVQYSENKPGEKLVKLLSEWLSDAKPVPPRQAPPTPAQEPKAASNGHEVPVTTEPPKTAENIPPDTWLKWDEQVSEAIKLELWDVFKVDQAELWKFGKEDNRPEGVSLLELRNLWANLNKKCKILKAEADKEIAALRQEYSELFADGKRQGLPDLPTLPHPCTLDEAKKVVSIMRQLVPVEA